MIPKECKRLAEVDFPIAEVSRHAIREKSIRHGHPSTLHLWWARRPLASCRAVLLSLLLPDPLDPYCPAAFKDNARKHLSRIYNVGPGDEEIRRWLLKLVADFANWNSAGNPTFIEVGRGVVLAAYPDGAPLVVDPFAGGGSIPLEALRLGCDTFASDLNPVAGLILKVTLEDIPRRGPAFVEELQRLGAEIRRQAQSQLAELYPGDPNGATPIAYLWARTVRCESPDCGAEIPLLRSFWLCKKRKHKKALRHQVVSSGDRPRVSFDIFEPDSEDEVHAGTASGGRAICLCCGVVLPPKRVREQLIAQSGGTDVVFDAQGHRIGGARLLAVVTVLAGAAGRDYRLPTERDYSAVCAAGTHSQRTIDEWERSGRSGLAPFPVEPIPLMSGTFNVPLYGMKRWGDLFTARQKVALSTLIRCATTVTAAAQSSDPIARCLALAVGRCTDRNSALTRWDVSTNNIASTFARQALPMVWDFAEVNPLGGASGDWTGMVDWIAAVADAWPPSSIGLAEIADAAHHPLPDQAASVWFTDPPYYFAVPYADLSDFFFVWLKRALPGYPLLSDPFDPANPLTPKERELCEMAHWDRNRYAHKDRKFFEEGMRQAFAEGRRILSDDGVGSVVFAHKTTEGWEALLSGIIRGGWTITGSWPIATEMESRLRARDSAALATSVHLVCRPRMTDAPVGDWTTVVRDLQRRVQEWIPRLQHEGVRGADLVFACIGPALEVFSRYARVETAEGREVGLPEYLERVWAVVGQTALGQVLGAASGTGSAFEEDARLTSLFLWTLQTSEQLDRNDEPPPNGEETGEEEDVQEGGAPKGLPLPYDVVRRFAQPLGINLPDWEDRVIVTKKGVVFLRPVAERSQQLFGDAGADLFADEIERDPSRPMQLALFEERRTPEVRGPARRRTQATANGELVTRRGATTLDRVHAAMLLQAGGRSAALRALLQTEQERGPDFMRLANALSALYPRGSEEKRLVDAMLLAVPR